MRYFDFLETEKNVNPLNSDDHIHISVPSSLTRNDVRTIFFVKFEKPEQILYVPNVTHSSRFSGTTTGSNAFTSWFKYNQEYVGLDFKIAWFICVHKNNKYHTEWMKNGWVIHSFHFRLTMIRQNIKSYLSIIQGTWPRQFHLIIRTWLFLLFLLWCHFVSAKSKVRESVRSEVENSHQHFIFIKTKPVTCFSIILIF